MKTALKTLLGIMLPLAFILGWWVGLPSKSKDTTEQVDNNTQWTCSMHPQIRQPNPGLCPICNMDLIPLTDDGAGALREVKISRQAAALLDLRVTPVHRSAAVAEVRLFGRIDYDERKLTTITSRVAGRLDRLFVDFTGAMVREGDHLAEIYSPDLLVAQRELIEAKRAFDSTTQPSEPVRETRRRLLSAARERLRLLDFNEQQIKAIETSLQPNDHLTLYAPQAGIVTNKLATEGQYVKTGDPLFKVADLSSMWLRLEAYENDLQWLRYAQDVEFRVDAVPGRVFHGRIAFIDPGIDPERRVAKVRVNVDNSDLALKPGMFAEATVHSPTAADGRVLDPSLSGKWISPMHPEIVKDGPGACDICGMDLVPAEELGFIPNLKSAITPILIPASAVLRTGQRAVVYVQTGRDGDPIFEGREIVLGPRVGEQYIVDAGLDEGELVLSRGAFKLDSELQIKGKPSMMNPNAGISEKPVTDAPGDLAGQWSAIPRILDRLMMQPDTSTITSMVEHIRQIDTEWLQDDELNLWNEYSRRLLNQLELASKEVRHSPNAAVNRVARALEETGRHLGLPYQAEAGPPASPEIAKALTAVIHDYLQVANALANDDDTAAASASSRLLKTTTQHPQLKLIKTAKALVDASDITNRRTALKPFSDALVVKIRQHGIDAVGTAYVIHCPMAFGNTGADWISGDTTILNPYFGDAMLNCGTIAETLSIEPQKQNEKAPSSSDQHTDH